MYVGLKTFGVVGMMLFPVVTIILVKLQDIGIIHLFNMPEGKSLVVKKTRKNSQKANKSVEKAESKTEEVEIEAENSENESETNE